MRFLSRKPGLERIWQICIILIATSSFLSAKDWDIVTIEGREYVTATNVANFYKIERLERQGNKRIFRHPSLIMEWTIGTQAIYVNRIKFNLSLNIAEIKGHALISTVDLAKLIDPVVRPSYIKKPIDFDTVVIDPGHGGHDTGAKGRKGFEKNYNLDLSLRLKSALERRGFRIVMTRSDDRFIELGHRVAIANAQKRAIFISIHHNSTAGRTATGVETYALAPQGTASTNEANRAGWSSSLSGNIRDAENIALATAVHAHVIHDLKPTDRGIKRARFNVLRGINKPAILYEGGFLTNPTEAAKIHDPAYRQRTAESIANAVVKFKSAVGKK
ncbi:MAG: N-acetylmuramoyl-L-alanine amidase [Verrucomicrobiales bacterium]|nr:N-acetylmuramoyl-L-alanine amidase [Verrucomicrobiales bacterium]